MGMPHLRHAAPQPGPFGSLRAGASELVRDALPARAISIRGFGQTHLLVPTAPGRARTPEPAGRDCHPISSRQRIVRCGPCMTFPSRAGSNTGVAPRLVPFVSGTEKRRPHCVRSRHYCVVSADPRRGSAVDRGIFIKCAAALQRRMGETGEKQPTGGQIVMSQSQLPAIDAGRQPPTVMLRVWLASDLARVRRSVRSRTG
jgi:hypothetical protein